MAAPPTKSSKKKKATKKDVTDIVFEDPGWNFIEPAKASSTVWIGNIEPYVTDDQIRDVFVDVGSITNITIKKDSRCAFVNFETAAAAGQAITFVTKNRPIIAGQMIEVDFYIPKKINTSRCKSIWVGNLNERATEDDLKALFSTFGTVESVKVKQKYAFVNFQDDDQAEAARSLSDTIFMGHQLIINYAKQDKAFQYKASTSDPKQRSFSPADSSSIVSSPFSSFPFPSPSPLPPSSSSSQSNGKQSHPPFFFKKPSIFVASDPSDSSIEYIENSTVGSNVTRHLSSYPSLSMGTILPSHSPPPSSSSSPPLPQVEGLHETLNSFPGYDSTYSSSNQMPPVFTRGGAGVSLPGVPSGPYPYHTVQNPPPSSEKYPSLGPLKPLRQNSTSPSLIDLVRQPLMFTKNKNSTDQIMLDRPSVIGSSSPLLSVPNTLGQPSIGMLPLSSNSSSIKGQPFSFSPSPSVPSQLFSVRNSPTINTAPLQSPIFVQQQQQQQQLQQEQFYLTTQTTGFGSTGISSMAPPANTQQIFGSYNGLVTTDQSPFTSFLPNPNSNSNQMIFMGQTQEGSGSRRIFQNSQER